LKHKHLFSCIYTLEIGLDLQKYIEIIQKKSRVTRGDLKIDQNELHSEKNEKPKVIPKPKRKRNQPKIKEENSKKKRSLK